jgi:signal transduction histidine kinase
VRLRRAATAGAAGALALTAAALAVALVTARAERERAEELVGRVAHDFSNLVNVIQGYADFTAEQVSALAEEDARLRPAVEDIEQVRSAAREAARLVRQLLALARHDGIGPGRPDRNAAGVPRQRAVPPSLERNQPRS